MGRSGAERSPWFASSAASRDGTAGLLLALRLPAMRQHRALGVVDERMARRVQVVEQLVRRCRPVIGVGGLVRGIRVCARWGAVVPQAALVEVVIPPEQHLVRVGQQRGVHHRDSWRARHLLPCAAPRRGAAVQVDYGARVVPRVHGQACFLGELVCLGWGEPDRLA